TRPIARWKRQLPTKACRSRNTIQFWKWRRTIPAFAQKFVSAWALRPNSCLSTCPNSGHSCVDDRSESRREHFLNRSSRERRAPALWRRGEVQLDRLAAGARARLNGELSGAGLEDLRQDLRRDVLGAVDADPGAEHSAACAVATRLVRCQSDALARHARVTLSLILCASLASFAPAQRVRPFWTESRRPVRGSPRPDAEEMLRAATSLPLHLGRDGENDWPRCQTAHAAAPGPAKPGNAIPSP